MGEYNFNSYCSNNLIWKFNKKAQYPLAIFRSKDVAILKTKSDSVYPIYHFRDNLSKTDKVIVDNIVSHNLCCKIICYFNSETSLYFKLVNPMNNDPLSNEYAQLHIIGLEYIDNRNEDDTQTRDAIRTFSFRDAEYKTMKAYLNDVGLEISKKINMEIFRRYNWSYKWCGKLIRFANTLKKDKYAFLDDIPLDEYILPAMLKYFYDPAKRDGKLSIEFLSNKLLIFHIL